MFPDVGRSTNTAVSEHKMELEANGLVLVAVLHKAGCLGRGEKGEAARPSVFLCPLACLLLYRVTCMGSVLRYLVQCYIKQKTL